MDKKEFMRQWGVDGMPLDKIRLANAAWDDATKAEREACVKTCEAADDTGNDTGIERDVAIWNKAVAYCARRLKERSNM